MNQNAHHFFYFSLAWALIGGLTSLIAHKFHFYHLKKKPKPSLDFNYPLLGLIGYMIVFFLAAPLGIQWISSTLKGMIQHSPGLLATIMQILTFSFTVIYLIFFCLIQKKETLRKIFIHSKRFSFFCLTQDFGLGILTWTVVFPFVIFVHQSIEWLTYVVTKAPRVEQVALQYFRLVKDSPYLLTLALFMIIIVAPIIEELVFRGFLYSYLKQKIGFKGALFLSALLFALFHFAPAQGVSNFPLLSSLFILALYLGFLYERQSSLFSPIALHMTFNSISVMRILLFSN